MSTPEPQVVRVEVDGVMVGARRSDQASQAMGCTVYGFATGANMGWRYWRRVEDGTILEITSDVRAALRTRPLPAVIAQHIEDGCRRDRQDARARRLELARAVEMTPTDWQALNHGVEPVTGTIVDERGAVGAPVGRAIDTLARMRRSDTIDDGMLAAGRQFKDLFDLAQLDPLRAADLLRVAGGVAGNLSSRSIAARDAVWTALQQIGGPSTPVGTACWWIVGVGLTAKEFSIREGWGGRPMNPMTVTGLVIAALSILEQHFYARRKISSQELPGGLPGGNWLNDAIERIRGAAPTVEVRRIDDGYTVVAVVPGRGACYLARLYRPERDGCVGHTVISERGLADVLTWIGDSNG